MNPWEIKVNLGEWALPFFVRWFDNNYLTYFGVHCLCFSVVYQKWHA